MPYLPDTHPDNAICTLPDAQLRNTDWLSKPTDFTFSADIEFFLHKLSSKISHSLCPLDFLSTHEL